MGKYIATEKIKIEATLKLKKLQKEINAFSNYLCARNISVSESYVVTKMFSEVFKKKTKNKKASDILVKQLLKHADISVNIEE